MSEQKEKRLLTEDEKNEIRRQQRMKRIEQRSGKSFESIITDISTPKNIHLPTTETPLFEVNTPVISSPSKVDEKEKILELNLPKESEKKKKEEVKKEEMELKKEEKTEEKVNEKKVEKPDVKPFEEEDLKPKSLPPQSIKLVDLIRKMKSIVLIVLSVLLFFKISFNDAKPLQIFFTVETIFGIYLFFHFASSVVRKF